MPRLMGVPPVRPDPERDEHCGAERERLDREVRLLVAQRVRMDLGDRHRHLCVVRHPDCGRPADGERRRRRSERERRSAVRYRNELDVGKRRFARLEVGDVFVAHLIG
jgi:hypothetical protein